MCYHFRSMQVNSHHDRKSKSYRLTVLLTEISSEDKLANVATTSIAVPSNYATQASPKNVPFSRSLWRPARVSILPLQTTNPCARTTSTMNRWTQKPLLLKKVSMTNTPCSLVLQTHVPSSQLQEAPRQD